MGVVVASALGYALSAGRSTARCEDQPKLAVWDEAREQAVREAFATVDVAHRDDALALALAHLDGYAEAWSTMQRDACEATHVRGEQSDELLDLRVACLGRRAAELDAVAALLARADVDVVDHAVEMVLKLPPVDVCADAEALRAEVPGPEDPTVAAEVDAIHAELDQVNALVYAGKTAEATLMARPLVERARATGHAPLRAKSLFALANALDADEPAAAEACFREAITAAAAGKDDRLLAEAFTELLFNVGQVQARHDEALSLAVGAEASVARAGSAPTLRIGLEMAIAANEFGRGRFEEATRRYEHAQSLILETSGPDDPRLRTLFNNYGAVMVSLGREDEAREQLQLALEHARRAFGPHHPYVADPLVNLANLEVGRGNGAQARALYEEALAILQGVPNQNRRKIAGALSNVVTPTVHQGDLLTAQRYAEQAYAEMVAVFGPKHPHVAAPLDALGVVAMAGGDLPTATRHFEAALALLEPTLGKQHPHHALVAANLGQAWVSQGRADEAAVVLDAARAVLRDAMAPEHPAVLLVDAAWAEAELERGLPEVALPLLERVAERIPEPYDAAHVTFALARALVRTGGDQDRALALARDARAFYAERGFTAWEERVARWLAAQGAKDGPHPR